MFRISDAHYEALAKQSFESYVNRLTSRLLGKAYDDARASRFPSSCKPEDISDFVRKAISMSFQIGFERENEVTPFVLLHFTTPPEEGKDPLFPWIQACLRASDQPASKRMDVIYNLLPPERRALVFPVSS